MLYYKKDLIMESVIYQELVVDGRITIELPSNLNGKMFEILIKPIAKDLKGNKKLRMRGALSKYADISKIEFESKVWMNSVEDNIVS